MCGSMKMLKPHARRVTALPPIRRRDFLSRRQFRLLVKHTLDQLEPHLSSSQRQFLLAVLAKRRTSLLGLWGILPHVVGAFAFVEAVQRAHWQLQLEEPTSDTLADGSMIGTGQAAPAVAVAGVPASTDGNGSGTTGHLPS